MSKGSLGIKVADAIVGKGLDWDVTGNIIDIQTGEGITVSADAVTVKLDGASISKSVDGIKVQIDGSTLTTTASGLKVDATGLDGNGLGTSGDELVVNTGDGITISADAVTVELDGSTLSMSASGLKVATTGSTLSTVGGLAVDVDILAG